ncbi:hypothetical protein [Cellulomonas sp. IC4_254]|uniref:hypothetical protein n=1 Tax=Cellulomonas sp. IC4_254 TaxID=2714040 RepID=UPI001422114F|nr:hypothetical protein [Cellulomonas sp. IC4_254]NHT16540.1 hypothetical protein [Cellulomonas sp. IC4_254]
MHQAVTADHHERVQPRDRRAAGVRFAHTRPALAWGALTTVVALLPDSPSTPPRPLPRA